MARKKLQIRNIVQSTKWFYSFAGAGFLLITAYFLTLSVSEGKPGTSLGLGYGILSTLFMIGVALYGLRRRMVKLTRKFGFGRAQTWVQFHVYAGTLALLLMFMHIGFATPQGMLVTWLYFFSIWVTFSGIIGVILQKTIPKILASGLSVEVIYERIPELIDELRGKCESLVESSNDTLRDFYHRNIESTLTVVQPKFIYYLDITGGIQARIGQFNHVRKLLSNEEQEALTEVETYFRTKLELDAHYTLQKTLRWWLYLHLPASIILLVLIFLHIFAVIYY